MYESLMRAKIGTKWTQAHHECIVIYGFGKKIELNVTAYLGISVSLQPGTGQLADNFSSCFTLLTL